MLFPLLLVAMLTRSITHDWLVHNGWVGDFAPGPSRVVSYIAFMVMPLCVEMALVQRAFFYNNEPIPHL